MSGWTATGEFPRRLGATRRGWAACQCCGKQLDYQYGSIRWSCRDSDLCPECEGDAIAKRVIGQFRKRLPPKRPRYTTFGDSSDIPEALRRYRPAAQSKGDAHHG